MCRVVSGSKCQPLDIHATTEIRVQKAFFAKTQIFFAVDSTPRGFKGIFGVFGRSGRCPKKGCNKKQLNNDSLQRLFPPPKDPHFYSRYSGPWFPQTAGPFLLVRGIVSHSQLRTDTSQKCLARIGRWIARILRFP